MKNTHKLFTSPRNRGKMAMLRAFKNSPVRKMPRKKKKRFISKYGRADYKKWRTALMWLHDLRAKIIDFEFEEKCRRKWSNVDYGYGRQIYCNNNM